MKSTLKCLCKLLYTKNKASIEAGKVTKTKGFCKAEDKYYFMLKRKKDKPTLVCMRKDEMLALATVINFALWKNE
jgi:hypothetical protein